MQITLADGSNADLTHFNVSALGQLQFEQEQAFAARIQRAPKGSLERQQAIGDGYDAVCAILAEMNGDCGSLVMGFDQRYARLVTNLLRRIQRRGDAIPTLFEIGYGSGSLLAEVAANGFRVAGIEVSSTIRDQALAALPLRHHAQLYLGNFLTHTLGGDAGRFDVVYWNDVFEHIPPDEIGDFLARIRQILKPGGCLVTITPNWHERPSDVTGDFCPPRTEACGLHLKEYTLRQVTALLRQTGFTRVTTPLFVVPQAIVLAGGGLAGVKRCFEPLLEYLPYRMARLLCHGFGLSCTIAYK